MLNLLTLSSLISIWESVSLHVHSTIWSIPWFVSFMALSQSLGLKPWHVNILATILVCLLLNFCYLWLPRPAALSNLLRIPRTGSEPPVVFHWTPVIGSAFEYGRNPLAFFAKCREKYGDTFSFILFGSRITAYLGLDGNNFILKASEKDMSSRKIMAKFMTPIFGTEIAYDCSDMRFQEQKRLMKYGLTIDALRSYIPLIEHEALVYIHQLTTSGESSTGITSALTLAHDIVINTAVACFHGQEAREAFDSSAVTLVHNLERGMDPINFVFPWLPLPMNIARDRAQRRLAGIYMGYVQKRREKAQQDPEKADEVKDMMWSMMQQQYKDGTAVSDKHIAHMLIAMIMAGAHSSSATGGWAFLELAAKPEVMEELYQEQLCEMEDPNAPFTLDNIHSFKLARNAVKETFRLHPPLHSLLRETTKSISFPGGHYRLPPGRVVLSSPAALNKDPGLFADPEQWNPSRWTAPTKTAEVDSATKPTSNHGHDFLPFGMGRHRCSGDEFSYIQLTTIISVVVRELMLRQPDGVVGMPKTNYASLSSFPAAPAEIVWKRRERKEE